MTTISCSATTNIGAVRGNNEDNYYVNGKHKHSNAISSKTSHDNEARRQYLYAICDGMGGADKGEVASMIAVKALSLYQSTDVRTTIFDYIENANQHICAEIIKNNGVRIGTTLALLYIKDGKAVSYNIGDSRVYFFRKNKLTQLSEDHTLAQHFVNSGVLKKEEVTKHKDRNKLTQHLGVFAEEVKLEPHASREITIRKSDIFLLCSDGLTDMVDDKHIAEILSSKKMSASEIASKLVKTAIENGGRDNVTVIVAKVEKRYNFLG